MARYFVFLISTDLVICSFMADARPPDRAAFGSMSSSSSRSNTPAFERAFEDAHTASTESYDAVFTIERLLQRLLLEPEVASALDESGVDAKVLSSELAAYLQDLRKAKAGFATETDPNLRSMLQSTLVLWQIEGIRRSLSSLDVLAAIVRQGGSFAAERLSAYGFTADAATELADSYHASTAQKAETEFRQTKEKIVALSAQQPQEPRNVFRDAPENADASASSIANYRITVVSRDPMDEVQFKGAISADGCLSLLVETTPFEITFAASEIIAVFESVNSREGIAVELLAMQTDETEKRIGGFGGESGAILKNQTDLSGLWSSGYLR